MRLIIRWLIGTGIFLISIGLWGLYVYLIRGVHDGSDGISALIRVVTGTSWIMIAMGFYRVDVQIFKQAFTIDLKEFLHKNRGRIIKGDGDVSL